MTYRKITMIMDAMAAARERKGYPVRCAVQPGRRRTTSKRFGRSTEEVYSRSSREGEMIGRIWRDYSDDDLFGKVKVSEVWNVEGEETYWKLERSQAAHVISQY